MAPKRARRQADQTEAEPPKKRARQQSVPTPQKQTDAKAKSVARKSAAPKASAANAPININVHIVTLAGNTVSKPTVQRASTVQHLLDEAKAAFLNDERILHLQHAGQLLAPHQLLGDAGVGDGALLTLIFESKPLRLRTVDRRFSHMQATASVSRLELELVQHDAAVVGEQCHKQKMAVDAAAVNTELERLQEKARLAQKALAKAEGSLRAAEMLRTAARGELKQAQEDVRVDYDRVLDRLKSNLKLVDRDMQFQRRACRTLAEKAMLDVCDLALAGHVSDDELASAAEAIVAYQIPALQEGAIDAVVSSFRTAAKKRPSGDGDVRPLLMSLSPGHIRALKVLSTAFSRSSFVSTGHADVPWVNLTVAICMNSEVVAADLLIKGASEFLAGDLIAMHRAERLCDTILPMLRLLRSAGFSAASRLQSAVCSELARGRVCKEHLDPCPIEKLAKAIIGMEDTALAASLVTLLETADAEQAPQASSCAMPSEAAAVGMRDTKLRDFLLSPTQTEIKFNTTKAGRMAIHRLIDGMGWGQKLSHASEGCGHSRALVVRKMQIHQARKEVERWKARRDAHRQLLEKMRAMAPVVRCAAPAEPINEQGKLEVRTFQQELEAMWDEDTMPTHPLKFGF
mmetsp:Transcript_24666/g.52339  ORF Transcript_24666/g.52339 Transcript_24666/m.52339 type:complete len:631 (+) Transcript_24666:61-1953(+)